MAPSRICLALVGILGSHARGSTAFVLPAPFRAAAASSGEAAAAPVEPQDAKLDLPQALIFDCDGVLADTERDGHRPAFNAAFKIKNLGEAPSCCHAISSTNCYAWHRKVNTHKLYVAFYRIKLQVYTQSCVVDQFSQVVFPATLLFEIYPLVEFYQTVREKGYVSKR